MLFRRLNIGALIVLAAAALACAPKAAPLAGAPVPAVLPHADLAPVHMKYIFQWRFSDGDTELNGDGAARIAPPDSARLDFFVARGMGSGHVLLIGDELRTPSTNKMRSVVPPPPLLWASLGRLRIPAAGDTVARQAGDTLRIEVGTAPRWRATFVGAELRQLAELDGGSLQQEVVRDPRAGTAHYQHRRDRHLDITLTHVDTLPGFDADIWQ